MHMRLLDVEVETDGVDLLRRLYAERVLTALGGVRGCRFAGLIQSASHAERCLSLTLWDSPEDASAYERSGLFGELIEESKIYFSKSVEYTIRLSEDLRVEYVPVEREPVLRSYPIAAQSGTGAVPPNLGQQPWVRIVSLQVLEGRMDEFKRLYVTRSIPALRSASGCLFVYLLESEEKRGEVFSVTLWKSREDAVAYERSGVFERLIETQKHTLCGHAGGRLLGAQDAPRAQGTGDILVEHYTVLSGRSFG